VLVCTSDDDSVCDIETSESDEIVVLVTAVDAAISELETSV
jgi:hypothetical protein